MLDDLRKIAFKFQIEPEKTVGHAARVSSVISVLANLNLSFKNYLEVEFSRNSDFVKAYDNNNKTLESLQDDLELLLVDLKFGSFEASAAPNVIFTPTLFIDKVDTWKKDAFTNYKENILYGDFDNQKYLKKIEKQYSPFERNKIFKPLFQATSSDKSYKVKLLDKKSKKVLKKPEGALHDFYVPKVVRNSSPKSEFKTVQIFAKVKKEGNELDFSKKIKHVYYFEELEYETYPFKPTNITYLDTIYILYQQLNCKVDYEENMYLIHNDDFNLTVWGESREEVENSFSFAFHALYQNYALEVEEKLSSEAKQLKVKLLSIVKKVIDAD